MDKFYTKIIVDNIGVRQAKFVPVLAEDFKDLDAAMDRVEAGLEYPVFVKPSKAGSSKGVSKAVDRQSLKAALEEAVKFDNKILVEETIVGVRCSRIQGQHPGIGSRRDPCSCGVL